MSPLISQAYDFILQQTLNYQFEPGEIISDSQIAGKLGVSRTPVREAILLLQNDGILQNSKEGKTIVTPITMDDLSDILHVRSSLESEAIRIIALNGWLSDNQYAEMERIHRVFSSTNAHSSLSEHYSCDDLFHSTLISFSNSRRIKEATAQMRLEMQRFRWMSLLQPTRQTSAIQEHANILAAIGEKDVGKSVDALISHFERSEFFFRSIFRNGDTQQIAKMLKALIV
jgi:DNA-binding GntR family transcriptional regulator